MITVVADVRDLSAMQGATDKGIDRFGGIDIVMANAGIATMGRCCRSIPRRSRRCWTSTCSGVFHTVRAALPSVIDRRGYVLIVSSLAAYAAASGMAPYHAAKAGVEHFANALRLEVAHRGVAVGSAHMSWIDTPLVRESKADLSTFNEMIKRAARPAAAKPPRWRSAARLSSKASRRASARINCPDWVGLLRG